MAFGGLRAFFLDVLLAPDFSRLKSVELGSRLKSGSAINKFKSKD